MGTGTFMSTDRRQQNDAPDQQMNVVVSRIAPSEDGTQAAVPTLLLMIPCLVAGIWILISN